eukprot:TRINITY_DN31561_c0_g1_i5.p1 TRINITY_DN31561_c0_g1~~TRINITY_DN31561_c0_g1_i5.p1  ORF type:complete len:241 (-),score=24.32 TRINITY_DN31561_c0_g1_i5:204-926(-)
MASLSFTLRFGDGRTAALDIPGGATLGRASLERLEMKVTSSGWHCVQLSGSNASRVHAILTISQYGQAFLEDLHTANGTYVDGVKLDPGIAHDLRFGSEIRFAEGTPPEAAKLVCRVAWPQCGIAPLLQAKHSERVQAEEVMFVDESGERVDAAHKFVLELYSSVIQAMLASQAVEAQTGKVTVQQAFVAVLPKAIEFMYGLPIEIDTFDVAAGLCELANYYDIRELFSKASQILSFVSD